MSWEASGLSDPLGFRIRLMASMEMNGNEVLLWKATNYLAVLGVQQGSRIKQCYNWL